MSELPKGWVETTLGEIQRDLSQGINPADYPGEEFELFSVPSFPTGAAEVVRGSDVGSNKQTVEPNAVLLCKINPRINRVWVVDPKTNLRAIASTEWIPFWPIEGINPHYLAYYLQQNQVRDFLAQNASGVGGSLMRVKSSTFAGFPFVIAPFAEQERIVAEIEKHLTRLDAATAALKRVQAKLKRYRASVLRAACEGRLVATEGELARKERRYYEPASELLKRILRERRARWEADTLAKLIASGMPPKDDRWKQKYKEPAAPDISGLPQLPEGWCWTTLGQLTWSVKDGPHYSPKYSLEGVPFITGGQVRPSGIDFGSAKFISRELHEELSRRCHPEKGDILLTKGGTTGIARVNTYDIDFSVWVHVAVLKPVTSVEPFYLQHALNSPFCYAQSQRYTHGVGNQDLGLTRMVNIVLALPPFIEQARINAELEGQFEAMDRLESALNNAIEHAARLKRSTLRSAFSGKLVPQDPADEPASVLLERIRAERASKPRQVASRRRQELAHV